MANASARRRERGSNDDASRRENVSATQPIGLQPQAEAVRVSELSDSAVERLRRVIATQFSFETYQKRREVVVLNRLIDRALLSMETIADFHITKDPATPIHTANTLPNATTLALETLLATQARTLRTTATTSSAAAALLRDVPAFARAADVAQRSADADAAALQAASRLALTSPAEALRLVTARLPFRGVASSDVTFAQVADGQFVRLVCPRCDKTNLRHIQSFINHCRILHNIAFPSHAIAARECGRLVNPQEVPLDSPARRSVLNNVDLPHILNFDWGKERIVQQSQSIDPTRPSVGGFLNELGEEVLQASFSAPNAPSSSSSSMNLTTESGVQVRKTTIKVHEPDTELDVSTIDDSVVPTNKSNTKSSDNATLSNANVISLTTNWDNVRNIAKMVLDPRVRMQYEKVLGPFEPNGEHIKNISVSNDTMDTETTENKSNTKSSALDGNNTLSSGTGSRFYIKKKIQIGNFSQCVVDELMEHGLTKFRYKWMVYVMANNTSSDSDFSSYVRKVRFYLHPDYKPYDIVETYEYPYRLTRFGWGEFPIRIQIFFNDPKNKPVDIIHNISLDLLMSRKLIASPARILTLDIDRSTAVISKKAKDIVLEAKDAAEELANEVSGNAGETIPRPRTKNDLRAEFIRFKVGGTPLTLSQFIKKAAMLSDFVLVDHSVIDPLALGYRVAASEYEFFSWPLGKRKSIEYRRASKLRQFLIDLKHPDFSDRVGEMSIREIMVWLENNGFNPKIPEGLRPSDLIVGFQSTKELEQYITDMRDPTKRIAMIEKTVDKSSTSSVVDDDATSYRWCKYCGIFELGTHERTCSFIPGKEFLWKARLWTSSLFQDWDDQIRDLLLKQVNNLCGLNKRYIGDTDEMRAIFATEIMSIINAKGKKGASLTMSNKDKKDVFYEIKTDLKALESYKKLPVFTSNAVKTKYKRGQKGLTINEAIMKKFMDSTFIEVSDPRNTFIAPVFLGVPQGIGIGAQIISSWMVDERLQEFAPTSWGVSTLITAVYPKQFLDELRERYGSKSVKSLNKDGLGQFFFLPNAPQEEERVDSTNTTDDTSKLKVNITPEARHVLEDAIQRFATSLLNKSIEVARSEYPTLKSKKRKRNSSLKNSSEPQTNKKRLIVPLHLWKAVNLTESNVSTFDFLSWRSLGDIDNLIRPIIVTKEKDVEDDSQPSTKIEDDADYAEA